MGDLDTLLRLPSERPAPLWKPGEPEPEGYKLASDGLLARNQGDWALQKLKFLEYYGGPAIGATRGKAGATHYVDLYAGPGRTVSTPSSDRIVSEFEGSPIILLNAGFVHRSEMLPTTFGQFHFVNFSALDHWLLHERIERTLSELGGRIMRDRIHEYHKDANLAVHDIFRAIPYYAYALVFADIEGPDDLAFDTLRAIRRRHASVDLYVLYPTHLGLERLMAYRGVCISFCSLRTA